MSEHSDLVKRNFEKNYQSYDSFIHQVVPGYEDLHQQIITVFREHVEEVSRVVDLGIGTGKTSKALCEIYKNISVKGYNLSPQMLKFAEERLYGEYNYDLIEQDIADVTFQTSFEACVSVLAIHHLNALQKKLLFEKIFEGLPNGGIFVIGDRIDFVDVDTKRTKLEFFKKFLIEDLGEEQGNTYYDLFDKEDQPSTLAEQMQWLEEIGFSEVKCTWEYSIYAVFYAIK